MKKLNLKLGSIKEMLSKEQMKKVLGGDFVDQYGNCLDVFGNIIECDDYGGDDGCPAGESLWSCTSGGSSVHVCSSDNPNSGGGGLTGCSRIG